MEKLTIYLIIAIVICLTILGISAEFFTYKYYELTLEQKASQQTTINTNPTQNTTPSQTSVQSSEKLITSFNFQNPTATGVINQTSHTITITVPPITDITKLTPTIGISDNATISPASNVQQDFTNPVAYLVTAQNSSTQEYIVTVNVASILKSVEKQIISFKLSGVTPEADGTIDNDAHTVYAIVPDDTDLTQLTPIIGVSSGATISPESGKTQDFTNPVIYTVTDIYGSTQNYTVTIQTESASG